MVPRNWRSAAFIAVVCLLASCTSPPATSEGMTAADPPAIKPNWVVKSAIAVGDIAGGGATNASGQLEVGSDAFRQALQQSLQAAGYLAAGPKPRYRLSATLQELDEPKFALTDDTTVSATVLYRLIGRGANAQYSITTSGTATFDESAIFGKRLQLASERALQANIGTLLQKLQKF